VSGSVAVVVQNGTAMTEERTTPERARLEINVVQVAASALAAITSAVLLSTVGVAGTIIGAAIGSVCATAGSALYSYSIRASRERVARAQAAAFARMQAARAGMFTRPMDRPDAGQGDRPDAPASLEPSEKEPPAWREALRRLPWKRVALIAVGVFVVVMILIVGFELITGKAVSQYTGGTKQGGAGTSIPGWGGTSKPSHTPTPTPTPSSSPTQPATSVVPSAGTSTSPSPTTTATTPAPSAPPTPTPTPTPSPSATASATPSDTATSSATPSP
jgi:hypothetical protein